MNTTKKDLSISEFQIEVTKKNIKNIHLGVYPPQGKIRVAAPNNSSDEVIRLFIISKIPWIKKQKQKFEKQKRQTKREYLSGESHYYFGERYLLNVIKTDSRPKVELNKKKYIDFYINSKMTLQQKEKLLENFYRLELKKQIPKVIQKWETLLDEKVNEVLVKKMKTKWGSCNPEDKRIWVNLELAKNPNTCLEYVILHEMLHFKEKNHTDKFYNLMDFYLPQWPQRKDELNNSVLGFFEWSH